MIKPGFFEVVTFECNLKDEKLPIKGRRVFQMEGNAGFRGNEIGVTEGQKQSCCDSSKEKEREYLN